MHAITQGRAERVCPVCGSTSYEHFADERIDTKKINAYTYASRKQPEFMCLRLVLCTECDLIYAPTPTATHYLAAAYADAAYDSGPEARAAAISYAKALESHVAQLAGRNAAVDVGAGSGAMLPWLRECGFNPVIGIEPSHAAIKSASLSVRPLLRQGLFSRELLADARPSLLCSFMTLEHLADPGGFVQSVHELLEPGGMFAVVVHNWRAPVNRLLGLHSPIIDIEHLQLFSPQSIRILLERTGFTSLDLQSIENDYPLRYWLRLTPLPVCVKIGITRILKSIGLLDKKISLRVGNMIAVGIK